MTAPAPRPPAGSRAESLLDRLRLDPSRADRVTHVEHVPSRVGRHADWPGWVDPLLVSRLQLAGVERPWEHQVQAAELAHGGDSVVVATGTASGKSLAYLLPVLSALLADDRADGALPLPDEGAGDRPAARRARAQPHGGARRDLRRRHAARGARLGAPARAAGAHQPRHAAPRGAAAARRLGVVPARAALRRRRRVPQLPRGLRLARRAGAAPAAAGLRALRLLPRLRARLGDLERPGGVGRPAHRAAGRAGHRRRLAARHDGVRAVGAAADARLRRRERRARTAFRDRRDRRAARRPRRRGRPHDRLRPLPPRRRGGRAERPAARRRGGARAGRRGWRPTAPATCRRSGASWSGACSRATCSASRRRTRSSSASTSSGLDAVVLTGWPGTVASVWQQAGRAGRAGQGALAVFVARDDPLDTYLVHHPEALFGRPVEATVLDPANPYVLGPHLCCAAAELPLTEDDLPLFGGPRTSVRLLLADLVRRGLLRARPEGLVLDRPRAAGRRHPRHRRAAGAAGRGAAPGRLLGTVDSGVGALAGARGRGLPAPGRDLPRRRARPRRGRRAGARRGAGLLDVRPRRHRHRASSRRCARRCTTGSSCRSAPST